MEITQRRSVDCREASAFGVSEAFVLQQIRFWYDCAKYKKVGRDGETYVKFCYDKIQEYLPFLSVRTIRRAVKKLESLGALCHAYLSRGASRHTKWYRINEEIVKELGGQIGRKEGGCSGQNGHSRSGQNGPFINIEKGIKERGTTRDQSGTTPAEIIKLKSRPPETSGEKGENNKEGKIMVDGKSVESVYAIAGAVTNRHTTRQLVPNPTSLERFWRVQCAVHYDDMSMAKPPSKKHLGQFKYLLQFMPEGTPLDKFLIRVIDHWYDFAITAKNHSGTSDYPARPKIEYLLAHLDTALNWYTQSLEIPTHKPVNLSAPATMSPEEADSLLESLGLLNG